MFLEQFRRNRGGEGFVLLDALMDRLEKRSRNLWEEHVGNYIFF